MKEQGSPRGNEERPRGDRRCRILIVDDEEEVLAATSTLLVARGWEVRTATDSESAVRILQDAPNCVDVLIVDYLLSDGSGLDLLRALESQSIRIPAIMCSGMDQKPGVDGTVPAYSFLRKPYRLQDLEEAIWQAIDSDGPNSTASTRS